MKDGNDDYCTSAMFSRYGTASMGISLKPSLASNNVNYMYHWFSDNS